MRFRPSVVGELAGPDIEVAGATIDSRRVRGGELFVPVKAARDGHDFIPAALAAGAPACLTERAPGGGGRDGRPRRGTHRAAVPAGSADGGGGDQREPLAHAVPRVT